MLINFFDTKSSKRMAIESSNDLKTSTNERIVDRCSSTAIVKLPIGISDAVKTNANYWELWRVLELDEFTNQDALNMVKEWEPSLKTKSQKALEAMIWQHLNKYNESASMWTSFLSIDKPGKSACEHSKAVLKKSNEVDCDMQVDLEEAEYYGTNEEKKYSTLKGNFDDVRDADERQNAQIQVIYLWRTTKLSQKSIAMKLNLSLYFVRSAVRAYKARVKQMIKLNREKSNKCREKITPEQIEEIRCFFMTNKNKALTLNDVKEAVWRDQPPDVTPTDPTVSKVLKTKLWMSYRRLSKHPPKILRDEHIRSFWEAVMIQTILRSNFYELIFIDDLFPLHFLH